MLLACPVISRADSDYIAGCFIFIHHERKRNAANAAAIESNRLAVVVVGDQ